MANFIRKYALTVAIIWLSFTAMFMVHGDILHWVGHFNYAMLIIVLGYGYMQSEYETDLLLVISFIIILVFIGDARELSPTNALGAWSLLTYPIMYVTIIKTYLASDITRQVTRAGWFVWGWCSFALVTQMLLGLRPNATSAIVFHPSYGALLFNMLLPFGLDIKEAQARRVYLAGGLLVCLSVSWRSRTGLLSLIAVVVVHLVSRLHTARQRIIACIGAILPSTALIVWLITWRPRTVAVRAELWRGALTIIKHNPWGVGPGQFHVWSEIEQLYAAYAHNGYLTLIAEWGVFGYLLLAAVLIVLYRSRRHRPHAANLALAACAVHNLTDDPLRFWHIALLTIAALATTKWKEFWVNEFDWQLEFARISGDCGRYTVGGTAAEDID